MPAPLPSNDAPDTEPMRASGRALAAGERWAEFEIERVLCETATSIVYLATDHALEVQVAVKEYMPLQLAWRDAAGQVHPAVGRPTDAWEAGRRAFIGEARLLARTDHPALMRVLRLWEAQGTACCVMPYLPGKRLIDARESPEWLPPEAQVLQMLDALLGALANFHAVAGAAHGGVRPSNILVRPGGTPVLLGPGQASRATASDLVESLMARLEPSFAPPELSVSIGDHAPGPWSDLYALAAVMRWWMTGAAPPSAAQVAAGRRLEPMGELMRRLHGAWPQRPYAAALLEALDAALLPLPRERPRSVAEFRERLGPLLPGRWLWLDAGQASGASGSSTGPAEPLSAPVQQALDAPAASVAPMARTEERPRTSRPMPLDPLARRSGPMPLDEAPSPLPVDEALERFRAARQRGPEPGWRGWWARWQQPLVGAGLLALFASVWFMDPPAPSVTVRPLGLPQERVSEEPAEAPTAASDVSPATERPASGPAAAPSR
jgi:serine/threonine protein kinase